VNPTTLLDWRDVEPTPTGAIIVDEMNGRMSAYLDNRLNLVPVGDVSAGRRTAFGPDRIGQRRLLGYRNLTLRSLRPGIAESSGARVPLSRIRQALTTVIACVTESADRVTAGGTPSHATDSVKTLHMAAFLKCEKARNAIKFAPAPATEMSRGAIFSFHLHNTNH